LHALLGNIIIPRLFINGAIDWYDATKHFFQKVRIENQWDINNISTQIDEMNCRNIGGEH
jgi:hypothetical protein